MSAPRANAEVALTPVLANRFETIGREMNNTLLRTARSGVLGIARDFSCAIVTAADELLVSSAAIPSHAFGVGYLTETMSKFHGDDLREGDAFLHNSPYHGNSHPADHTILVPVFFEGEHVLTMCAKAHQADIGNAKPTTYNPVAHDVYDEGALIFPCVRVQQDRHDVADVIRMCRMRIRVPDQWYGDYLAALGAARVGERAAVALYEKHGRERMDRFIRDWFDYSARLMERDIRSMPSGTWRGEGRHDPLPGLPDGLVVRVEIEVDASEGRIVIDLRDNPDCQDNGLNLTRQTSTAAALSGMIGSMDPAIPLNDGTFRQIDVLLRENCCVGIPRHPHSCSTATTNLADRVVNAVRSTFSQLGPGYGTAEAGPGMPGSYAVISGIDPRTGGRYVNQIFLACTGGPATPTADGWVNFSQPIDVGVMARDSVEVDEQKYPLRVRRQGLIPDSEGAGRRRGAPGALAEFGPSGDELMNCALAVDGRVFHPKGVRGGGTAIGADVKVAGTGALREADPTGTVVLAPGERLISVAPGGGGYGDPALREPDRVLKDVREGWISAERAREIYRVVIRVGDEGHPILDEDATTSLRAKAEVNDTDI